MQVAPNDAAGAGHRQGGHAWAAATAPEFPRDAWQAGKVSLDWEEQRGVGFEPVGGCSLDEIGDKQVLSPKWPATPSQRIPAKQR